MSIWQGHWSSHVILAGASATNALKQTQIGELHDDRVYARVRLQESFVGSLVIALGSNYPRRSSAPGSILCSGVQDFIETETVEIPVTSSLLYSSFAGLLSL